MGYFFWNVFPILIFIIFNLAVIVGLFLSFKKKRNLAEARFLGSFAIAFGILLGFYFFAARERFQKAANNIDQEAKDIRDLYRDATVFSEEFREKLTIDLKKYLYDIIYNEWPQMLEGKKTDGNPVLIWNIWKSYINLDPETDIQKAMFNQSIDKLTQFTDARIQRFRHAEAFLGLLEWIFLITGAFILVLLPCFYEMESFFLKAVACLLVANFFAFILFNIFSLDNPFTGYTKLDPSPYQDTLNMIENWPPK